MKKKILSLLLCLVMCFSVILQLAACKKDKGGDSNNTGNTTNNGTKADAFVIMTDALDGVFNPFFSTTAADGSVVGMTQISMLTTGRCCGLG